MIPGLHEPCGDCAGVGSFLGGPLAWRMCARCDGLGRVFVAGGPRFGAPSVLAERAPGEVVELATGHRGRVCWHIPRLTSKTTPEITFLALLDDFDDSESRSRAPFPSSVGVLGRWPRGFVDSAIVRPPDDDGMGTKGADEIDPFTIRAQAAGALL